MVGSNATMRIVFAMLQGMATALYVHNVYTKMHCSWMYRFSLGQGYPLMIMSFPITRDRCHCALIPAAISTITDENVPALWTICLLSGEWEAIYPESKVAFAILC